MATRRTQRWIGLIATLIVAVIALFVLRSLALSLRSAGVASGWLLLSMCVLLAAYNVRKKLPQLPLLRAYHWLGVHIYVGLLASIIFIFHAFYKTGEGFTLPDGALESALAVLFILVAGSGFVGLFLSRAIPPRLAERGGEVLYERIPVFRRRVREEAHRLVVESVVAADATTLADYYTRRLSRYFDRPQNFWYHLLQSSRPRYLLYNEMNDLDRYLSAEERPISAKLRELVQAKDDLDYHRALQLTLKAWLFVHIGFTYGMILMAIVHAVLMYSHRGTIA